MSVPRDIEMNRCWEVVNGDSKIGNDLTGNFMFPFMVHIGGETYSTNYKSGRNRGGGEGTKFSDIVLVSKPYTKG